MMEMHRDEEAVSAAIATVLLFGGVISIISLMMLTMMLAAKEGCYHDAIHTKRAELWLVIHNLFGGRNREACKLFNLYRVRARVSGIDRTEYVTTEGEVSRRNDFATHWGQRLSAAIVEADAARALALVDKEMAEHRPSALDVLIDGARRAAADATRGAPEGSA